MLPRELPRELQKKQLIKGQSTPGCLHVIYRVRKVNRLKRAAERRQSMQLEKELTKQIVNNAHLQYDGRKYPHLLVRQSSRQRINWHQATGMDRFV